MTLLLVLNVHGRINSSAPVRKALAELKVERKFTASVVPDDDATKGMLRLCKEYLAWSELDKELLTELLKKRGMASETRKLDKEALASIGYKKHEELATKMIKDEVRLSSVSGIRPFFRLSPPRGGFKSSLRRQATDKGTLGLNPKLGDIVRRMV